ncbi:hypothetical protein DVA67_029625 [Solirubrobacter sp. CPCC 204708]|uniref:Glycerophosphoryl diester phosphodiesterase membrane domain-containing protein n=1 Tax=Solirubrobacter deserti TaxID=2282478 RepID=A0ABT4RMS9_9ACTN|nr:hypothetical protein [Solirubrobacter deserti]MBE2320163.1 hypothetical protein [Solirubrobacter deserti]MDA0139883.1 hypothetical protein [Solirubrobacter deserti]
MASVQLRPLSIGEILDAALKVCMRHWKVLTLSVVPAILPLMIVSVLFSASFDIETDLAQFERTGDPADIPSSLWVSAGVSSIVTFLTTAIVMAVCFKAIADAWLGAEPSVGRSWRFALPRSFSLIALFLVSGVCYVLGVLACLIPTIWLWSMWAVASAALLFERVGPFKALGRSFQLIKQRFWAVLLLQIIVALLTFFVSAVVTGIPSGLVTLFAEDNEIATAFSDVIFGTIGNAIVLPIGAAVLTILYFDQRVRKEGFDVQLLAQGIGTEYDPNAPIPAPLRPVGGSAPQPQPGYWQPPPQPQQYGGGWSAPAHDAPPLRWGPAGEAPRDTRPPEESPWMSPGSPSGGGWAPPTGASPDRRWGSEDAPPPRDEDEDERPKQDRPDWQPPEERGPGGL